VYRSSIRIAHPLSWYFDATPRIPARRRTPYRRGFGPVTTPALRFLEIDGLRLAAWEWPGEDPPLLFAHATGFHARCWDAVIRALGGRRAIALDLRGHGRSAKPDPPYHWPDFGRDLARAAELLGLRDAIGIGHSMGGHSIVLAAALCPPALRALLLIDPTIFAPDYYGRPQRHDASFILRRRNIWKSWEEMYDRFRARSPFDAWQPEVLRDYCEYGVLCEGDSCVLACPPAVEASIYAAANAPEANPYTLLPGIAQPVTVMRGGRPWSLETFDLASSPTFPGLASRFPRARDLFLEGRSHYIPMESPDLAAREIEALIRQA
jgi:pimeloyl-ACP methyl ester carboxylesterase